MNKLISTTFAALIVFAASSSAFAYDRECRSQQSLVKICTVGLMECFSSHCQLDSGYYVSLYVVNAEGREVATKVIAQGLSSRDDANQILNSVVCQ